MDFKRQVIFLALSLSVTRHSNQRIRTVYFKSFYLRAMESIPFQSVNQSSSHDSECLMAWGNEKISALCFLHQDHVYCFCLSLQRKTAARVAAASIDCRRDGEVCDSIASSVRRNEGAAQEEGTCAPGVRACYFKHAVPCHGLYWLIASRRSQ